MAPDIEALGKYQIREELGRGGFATVYRALDTTLDREVALKVLHPQLLTDPTFVTRFQREARAVANLRHAHIVTVYEVGQAEGRLFIAMELAHGPDLAQAIAERGRIPWTEALAMLQPVCEALDYAHGQKVVHRDLKPSNILLDPERGPLLSDFGFARLMGGSSQGLSLSGGILGTPAYIAPEVWEIDAADPPADLYSLGCIVDEMLTGQPLFPGATPLQVMRAHDRGPQFPEAWPEGVPLDVVSVLGKALAREPESRYRSAVALWYALHDLEARAVTVREEAQLLELAGQWKAEAEAALVAGELSAARMAAGRWLAAAPEDREGKAFVERLAQISPKASLAPPKTLQMAAVPTQGAVRGEVPAAFRSRQACPSCGRLNRMDAAFCQGCGAPMTAASGASQRPVPTAYPGRAVLPNAGVPLGVVQASEADRKAVRRAAWWLMGLSLLALPAGIVGIVAAIGMLERATWGRKLGLACALLAEIIGLLAAGLLLLMALGVFGGAYE